MNKVLILLISFVLLYSCKQQSSLSGKLNIPGTVFTYTAVGKGIPCITFTGSEKIGLNFYPKELLDHFNLIHSDPKNMKDSIIENLTIDKVLEDIERVRKYIGIEKIAVMGHSMFSMLPLDYAVKYPENILFSISTGAIPFVTERFTNAANEYWEQEASDERKIILKKNIDSLKALNMSNLSDGEKFIKQYIAYVPYRFYDSSYDAERIFKDVKTNMNFINKFWGELLEDYDNTNNYKNIKSPVLVITGKYDFACPYFLWNEVTDNMQNCTFVIFENAGHCPMLEVPNEFTNTIVKWVKK